MATPLMANVTTPASVAWNTDVPTNQRGLLQRVTPVHMGVLLVLVMSMFVMTSGPAAMTAKPSRLPAATATGGGDAAGMPIPARAGTTAVQAATNAGAVRSTKTPNATKAPRAARTKRSASGHARTIPVGNARVRANVRAGGIPSPAAAANLAIAGGGRVHATQTGAVRMNGMPSPAASAELGPEELPFRPTDGVTLPRVAGERDSHAIDTHYSPSTLPMDEPVAAPAMTPGAAAAHAEHQASINQLSGATPAPVAPPSGGYSFAI